MVRLVRGRSGLLAQAALDWAAKGADTVVVLRFLGTTPDSSEPLQVLRSIIASVAESYSDSRPVPEENDRLLQELPDRLARATADRPLLVVLDALEQLPQWLFFLEKLVVPLPPNVGWLVSIESGGDRLHRASVRLKLEEDNRIELGPLNLPEAELLLDHWLQLVGRALRPSQRKVVLDGFRSCPSPLYLKLAFEIARKWTSNQPEVSIASNTEGLLQEVLTGLEAADTHGRWLTSRVVGEVAAGLSGLSEVDILEAVSVDARFHDEFLRHAHFAPLDRQLPFAVWARIYSDLDPYLAEVFSPGGIVLSFFHRQMSTVASRRYLEGDDGQEIRRNVRLAVTAQILALSRHIDGQSSPRERLIAGVTTRNLDTIREMIRTLVGLQDWDAIIEVIQSSAFLQSLNPWTVDKVVSLIAGSWPETLNRHDLLSFVQRVMETAWEMVKTSWYGDANAMLHCAVPVGPQTD